MAKMSGKSGNKSRRKSTNIRIKQTSFLSPKIIGLLLLILLGIFFLVRSIYINPKSLSQIKSPTSFSVPNTTSPVPSQTAILQNSTTPFPTNPPSIACNIGSFIYFLSDISCRNLTQAISDQRAKDTQNVQGIINNLRNQFHNWSSQIDTANKELSNCDNSCSSFFYPDAINQCLQLCGNNYNYSTQTALSFERQLAPQINWYQNYLNQIPNGVGNGACSDHGGVDCPAKAGNIGQVICNDGWTQSQVYYLNVKECLDMIISLSRSN